MKNSLQKMVQTQLASRDIKDPDVLEVMSRVLRHVFVPQELQKEAYDDRPLPIGQGQTISQPYIVALMTQILKKEAYLDKKQAGSKILEIGTGCGYQTAILATLFETIYSIEFIEELSLKAQKNLEKLNYNNIHFKTGDGKQGWPEKAPFDGILIAAAASKTPQTLLEQLKVGGVLIAPLTDSHDNQRLKVWKRTATNKWSSQDLISVRFVPLV